MKNEETYVKRNAEEISKFLDTTTVEKKEVKPVIAKIEQQKSSTLLRIVTLLSSNKDLIVILAIWGSGIILGYLFRGLQNGLSLDQIRVGLEAFIEILITILGSSVAIFLKMIVSKGSISNSINEWLKNYSMRVEERKEKQKTKQISAWGFSIKPKQ